MGRLWGPLGVPYLVFDVQLSGRIPLGHRHLASRGGRHSKNTPPPRGVNFLLGGSDPPPRGVNFLLGGPDPLSKRFWGDFQRFLGDFRPIFSDF